MKRTLCFLAAFVLFISMFVGLGTAPNAYADVSNPTYVGAPGYIDATTKAIAGGRELQFNTSDGIASPGRYHFAEENLIIDVDGSSPISAHVMLYTLASASYNNGYPMIALQDVPEFVSAFGGNLTYVQSHIKSLQATDALSGQTIQLVNLDAVAVNCGTAAESQTPITTISGNTITATYSFQTSLPPTLSVGVKNSSVTSGNSETINPAVKDDTYNTGYHADAISVTDPSGTTYWLAANGAWTTDAANQETNYYIHYTGGNQTGYTGSAPSFSTYTDSVSFPTKVSMPTGTYTVKVWTKDALDRSATPATTKFTLSPPAGLSLTASPSSLPAGQKSQLLATLNGVSLSNVGNYQIQISDQQANDTLGGQNTKTVSGVTVASALAESSTPRTESYVALLLDDQGNIVKESNSVSVTWTKPVTSGGPSIKVTPTANMGVPAGTPILVSYTTRGWQPGDYVDIKPQRKKGDIQRPWYKSNDSNSNDSYTEVENPTDGNSADIQYIAQLMNSSGTVLATATSGYFGWYSQPPIPSISMSVSPSANLTTGQLASIAYQAKNYSSGDYVDVTATGNGKHEWTASHDTQFSVDSSTETETPYNGNTVTVHYKAVLYSSVGKQLAQAGITVTWTSPKPSISITGSPSTMVPGQASYVTYKTQNMPSVDTVQIIGTGGADDWNVSGLTQSTDYFKEIENPSVGQTTNVNYTANIIDSQGNIVAQSTAALKWVNSWNGTIHLSASPQQLPTDSATTITATTSQTLPSGYSLVIMDETTGQEVDTGTTSTTTTKYTSYSAATDTFMAYITDGFQQIGNDSNQVTVQWSGLSLSASPLTVTVGQSSNLTVKGENVPSGDYLVIFNQSTGQEIGASQSTPYNVSVTESSAQSDTFVAYISSNNGSSGQWAQSNSVTVSWFGVTLTGNPKWLPINNNTELTANAANLPSGYEVDIKDQTTGQILATGQPGQTGLNLLQTRSTPQTDTFVADVLKPGNPAIPALTVPANTTPTQVSTYIPAPYDYAAIGIVSADGYLYVSEQYFNSGKYNGEYDELNVYSLKNNSLVRTVRIPYLIGPIAYSHGYVYIPTGGGYSNNRVYFLNVSNFALTSQETPYDYAPEDVIADSKTGQVYVALFGSYAMARPSTWNGQVGVYKNGKQETTINVLRQTGLSGPNVFSGGNGYIYVGCWGSVNSQNQTSGTGTAIINTATNTATYGWSTWGYPGSEFVHQQYAEHSYHYVTSMLNVYYFADYYQYGEPGYGYPNISNYSSYPSGSVIIQGTKNTPSPTTDNFPTWAFNSMPAYVPTSIFTATAQSSSDGNGAIWTSGANPEKNGTAFFQSTFTTFQTKSVTFSLPHVNDYAQVYVDGQPVMQYGNDGGNGNGSRSTTNTTLSLPPGKHQVIVEAVNNNQYQGVTNTPAGFALTVTSGGQTLLSTANATHWTTTGYVTSLPAGWFSGSVGSWSFSEAVMQETASPAIYQQKTFTVTNTAQSVAFESKPVSVTWYQYKLALTATPTTLPIKQPTNLNVVVGSGTPTGMELQIYDQTTNQVVGTSGTGATSYSAQWTEASPTTDTFVARLINPSNGRIVTTSNTVQVTWNQAPLTLSSAFVTHTPAWLSHLQSYNAYYSQHDPSLVRSTGDFWAGEQLLFRVAPSISNIASAHVTITGLQFSPYAPPNMPQDFTAPITIPLSYNAATGLLEGQTDASWATWFQYLQNGTYSAEFWVKSSDSQIATATAQFAIDGTWVGVKSSSYYHETQTY